MFAFDIHGRQPSVERLIVHLPGMNRVIFRENDRLDSVLDDPDAYETMLTEWFVANRNYVDGREYTYLEFPSY
jgi:hypothetical protein